jgi:hypothetical protein
MSISSVTLHWAGATGDVTADAVEYTAVYRVQTSSTADGPAAIAAYFRANGPWLNSSYSFGGDADSSAKCTKVSIPRHVAGSANVWEVTFTFSTQAGGAGGGNSAQQVDPDGNAVQNPLDFRPLVWIAGNTTSEPAEEAYYLGGFTHPIQKFAIGQKIRVQNSAGDRIDSPPIQIDKPIARIYVRVNRAFFDVTRLGMVGSILNQKVKFKGFLMYDGTFPAGTLKLTDISVQMKRESVEVGGVRAIEDYKEITSELAYNPDGWAYQLYDLGFNRQAAAGDPDGKGGTVSFTDILDGLAIKAPILDPVLGTPVKSPQLLDGAGQPLQDPNAAPVKITYRVQETFLLASNTYLTDAMEVAP